MPSLAATADRVALESHFHGVVKVESPGSPDLVAAYGFADRTHGIPMRADHQLALASGAKAFTALTVMSLVDEGVVRLDTTARSVLGHDLPLVGEAVTVEQLLAHRSGIGDYMDEDTDLQLSDYLMPIGVQHLVTTEDYLRVLDGFEPKFAAGDRFSYCNGAYVVLALIAERATGVAFHDLVQTRVCDPAGLTQTAFLRSDSLPASAAIGWIEVDGVLRTNVFHLPVCGSGDGGIYSTVDDISRLWRAASSGQVVSRASWTAMTARVSTGLGGGRDHGLGLWLDASSPVVMTNGCDAGVSFMSCFDPRDGAIATVISTSSDGAWPMIEALTESWSTDDVQSE